MKKLDAVSTSAKANVAANRRIQLQKKRGVKNTPASKLLSNTNKVQTTALTTAVSEYNQKLADYKTQLEKYYQDVLAYAAWENHTRNMLLVEQIACLLTKGLAENATGLIYKTDSTLLWLLKTSAGSADYLDKQSQSGLPVDEIWTIQHISVTLWAYLVQLTVQYIITLYEYTEDAWLKMGYGIKCWL